MTLYDSSFLKKISERELQHLLEIHPYLIKPKFIAATYEPQKRLKSGLADLVFYLKNEIIIVELKIVPLDNSCVLQLNGYLNDIKELFPERKISGIIVGEKPKENVLTLAGNLDFPIEVKIINDDIPIFIKICDKCRKANDKTNRSCVFCNSKRWLG
ncbi:MAG: DUF91 domain-containing protein [Desulfobacterales bacterium]|nr:DUF91 domain-containing protein [Desulfobacterales bacterium]MCP4159414.1 DUF91 domain-containing protein [Deltaproteobacteria bacterium]